VWTLCGQGNGRRRGSFTRQPLESRAAADCDYDYDTTPTPTDAAGGHGHLTPAEAALHARERPPILMGTPTSGTTCPTVPPSNPAPRRRSRCVAARKLDALALSGPATQRTPKHLHGLHALRRRHRACTESPGGHPTCGLRAEPKEGKQRCVPCTLPGYTPALTRFVSGCSYMVREGRAVCVATSTGAHPHTRCALAFLHFFPLPLVFPPPQSPPRTTSSACRPTPRGAARRIPASRPRDCGIIRTPRAGLAAWGMETCRDDKVLCVRLRGIPDDAIPSRSPSSSVPFVGAGLQLQYPPCSRRCAALGSARQGLRAASARALAASSNLCALLIRRRRRLSPR
jgi:hypothetical protein